MFSSKPSRESNSLAQRVTHSCCLPHNPSLQPGLLPGSSEAGRPDTQDIPVLQEQLAKCCSFLPDSVGSTWRGDGRKDGGTYHPATPRCWALCLVLSASYLLRSDNHFAKQVLFLSFNEGGNAGPEGSNRRGGRERSVRYFLRAQL